MCDYLRLCLQNVPHNNNCVMETCDMLKRGSIKLNDLKYRKCLFSSATPHWILSLFIVFQLLKAQSSFQSYIVIVGAIKLEGTSSILKLSNI